MGHPESWLPLQVGLIHILMDDNNLQGSENSHKNETRAPGPPAMGSWECVGVKQLPKGEQFLSLLWSTELPFEIFQWHRFLVIDLEDLVAMPMHTLLNTSFITIQFRDVRSG